jgi:hypothetical protein
MSAAEAASTNIRVSLGKAYALVRSLETATALNGYTLEDLLVEQIFFLDSSQTGDGAELDSTSTIRAHRPGRLQRIENLEKTLFGEDGASGVFKQAREYEGDDE